jgi:hypothetical protein
MVVALPQRRILGSERTDDSELDVWAEDAGKLFLQARHSSRSRPLKDSIWPLSVGLLKQQKSAKQTG